VFKFVFSSASPTGWWSENKDLLAFTVSLIALALSVWSTRKTVAKGEATARETVGRTEAMARTATFQRMHEMLVDPKAARGRRLLFVAYKNGDFPALGEERWDEINYALALYDTLGGYVKNFQVDEELVITAWHHPLVNIAEPVRAFMAHREDNDVMQPWAYLHDLLRRASLFTCSCPSVELPVAASAPNAPTAPRPPGQPRR
jgi:hypothetical protein